LGGFGLQASASIPEFKPPLFLRAGLDVYESKKTRNIKTNGRAHLERFLTFMCVKWDKTQKGATSWTANTRQRGRDKQKLFV
jgi:hypothetical protein